MTALVHPLSCACGKSELELFAVPPTQTAINSSQWMEYRPITSLTDTGPIEFVITDSGEEYVDLSETYLQVTAKIVKPTGEDLEQTLDDNGTVNGADADVGPVNLWLHSLFSQVDVSLNDRLVTPSMNTYPYRAYLETLLSYGQAAKESYLSAALWYKDSAGHLEDRSSNQGFKKRQYWTIGSNQVTLIGRPHLDLCFQDRLMLNGVDIKMRLVQSKDSFNLMGDGHVKIEDVSLFVRKVKVDSSVQLDHIKDLEQMTAKYPVSWVETKVFSVPKGNRMANQENLFLGQGYLNGWWLVWLTTKLSMATKRRIHIISNILMRITWLCMLMENKFHLNPSPRTLTMACVPEAMLHYLPVLDLWDMIVEIKSVVKSIPEGSHFLRGHFQLVKQGNLRLELHFKTPLPETINVIVYAEFDNVIEVDKARNVAFDYSAWIVNSWFLSWSRIHIRLRYSVVSIRSTVSLQSEMASMSSTQLQTLTLDFIGWLCLSQTTLSNTLTVMEEILQLHCIDGARRNNG